MPRVMQLGGSTQELSGNGWGWSGGFCTDIVPQGNSTRHAIFLAWYHLAFERLTEEKNMCFFSWYCRCVQREVLFLFSPTSGNLSQSGEDNRVEPRGCGKWR
jgi:hypothetical protein